ncbi:MAG: LppX_LprAFG lipoprotein [Anaerolineae bacterium]
MANRSWRNYIQFSTETPNIPKHLIVFLLSALLLTACSGPTSAPPDPLELVETAARTIQSADSFAVIIERTGAPVFLDPNGLIVFLRARGSYVAPDRVQARVRVTVSGIAGELDVIAIGDDQYYRHAVLTGGQWINAEFSPGFNAENLVRSESGLSRALQAIKDLELVGQETVDGVPMWRLSGTAIGSEVAALTFDLIPAQQDVTVDLFIRVDNQQAERMIIVQPDTVTPETPEPTTWTVEIFDYNGQFTIEPPG